MLRRISFLLIVWLFIPALISGIFCTKKIPEEKKPEVISLLGREFFAQEGGDSLLAAINEELVSDPDDPSLLFRKGRAFAGLMRYNEAIEIYSKCIEIDPANALYWRRRGHRYISLRQFSKAISDLETAASLQKPERTDSLTWDIWYHLGLAYYLNSDFTKAESAYRNCYDVTGENDEESLVAVSNWLHHTLRRLGKIEEAKKILEPIREKMNVSENAAYHKSLLLYKGEIAETDVIDETDAEPLELATTGYSVANWRLVNGDKEGAVRLFNTIVSGDYWPAFGFIAAEAYLAELKEYVLITEIKKARSDCSIQ